MREAVQEARSEAAARVLAQDAAHAHDKQFATTLARGLHLLTCFTPSQPVLGNKDLCRMLALPKATVSRLTYTLCQLGYLRQAAGSARFELGSATLALGYPVLANMPLRQAARPAMNALADHARASVSMGIRDRLSIVFIETSRSRRSRSSRTPDIGLSYPIAATAIGWAWLAACEPAAREAVLNEIRVKEPQLWDRHRVDIRENLERYAERGFCASFGSLRSEIVAVAAPYPSPVEGRIVVFNCAMHASRCSPEQAVSEIGPRLVAMLESLSGTASGP